MRASIQFIVLFMLSLLLACSSKTQSKLMAPNPLYESAIKNWQAERAASVTAPNGWMSLVGLYWLKEGRSTFGAAPSNKVVFPPNTPKTIGAFILEAGEVQMEIENSVPVRIDTAMPKQVTLAPDITGAPTLAELATFNWHLIKRENRFGIRLRDTANAAIQSFKGIPYFPIDQSWQILAMLKPAAIEKYITLRNVVDMDVSMKLEGYLVFELNGKTYELEAMDGGAEEYFIIFSDKTTSLSTYGSGRYMYVPKVDKNGQTLIDFNKAYNPPCAFTDFATCPLPSEKNHLELSVLAGEKDYH